MSEITQPWHVKFECGHQFIFMPTGETLVPADQGFPEDCETCVNNSALFDQDER